MRHASYIATVSAFVAAMWGQPAASETFEGEFDLAEYHIDRDETLFVDSTMSFGGNQHRLVAKLTTGGRIGDRVDEIDGQLFYSFAITDKVAIMGGVRHEFRPDPHRTYGALGVETQLLQGLAAESFLFLSEKGDLTGELKAVYDLPMAMNWTLQPRAVLGWSAQGVAEGFGSGLTGAELGLRLRFELSDAFAPYVGVSHDRLLGQTADIARSVGDEVRATHAVLGFVSSF